MFPSRKIFRDEAEAKACLTNTSRRALAPPAEPLSSLSSAKSAKHF